MHLSISIPGSVVMISIGWLAGSCVERTVEPLDDDDVVEGECAADRIWDSRLDDCVPAACGGDRYPAVPEGAERALYVDPGFDEVGLGDPTYPFSRIDSALAEAGKGTAVLLAAGDHPLTSALDIYQPGLQLVGRCPDLTRLVLEGPQRGLRVGQTSDVLLDGFAVIGTGGSAEGQPLLECFNSTGIIFEDLVLEDAADAGLLSWQCAEVILERVSVRRARGRGIHIGLNSGVLLRSCDVTDTREGAEAGASVQVEHGTDARIEDCSVTGGAGAAFRVTDIDTVAVRDNTADAPAGPGIHASFCEGADITGNTVTDARGFGLRLQASAGRLADNQVSATVPDDEGLHGIGLSVEDGAEVEVIGNIVTGSAEVGLAFVRSSGSVVGNQVDSTVPGSWGQGGRGMEIADVAHVQILDNLVQDNAEAGIVVMDAACTIEGNRVLGTQVGTGAADAYSGGHGIHVQTSTDVVCRGNEIDGAQHAGIRYLWVLAGEIAGNEVRNTGVGDGGVWGHGDGIQVVGADGDVDVEDNDLDGHDRCGLLVDQSRVRAVGNGMVGNEYALVVQNSGLMLADENDAHGNQVDESLSYDDRVFEVHDGAWLQLSDDLAAEVSGTKSPGAP